MAKVFSIIPLGIVVLFLLGKCVGNNEVYDSQSDVDQLRSEESSTPPAVPSAAEGLLIPTPSDPGASYRILKTDKIPNGNLEVTNQRDGPPGKSFARREIDCSANTFRYLGEGDTEAEASSDSPNISEMSELTGNSASLDVANAACTSS